MFVYVVIKNPLYGCERMLFHLSIFVNVEFSSPSWQSAGTFCINSANILFLAVKDASVAHHFSISFLIPLKRGH